MELSTRAFSDLTKLYHNFYVNKVKVVPKDIYNLLTPEALAHFILGDGTNDHGFGLILCTDSFTLQDVIKLMNVLIIKYRLECTLRKQNNNYRIYIRKNSMLLLKSIVKPYFCKSMLYKLGK